MIWQCSVALAQLPGTRDAIGIASKELLMEIQIKHDGNEALPRHAPVHG